MYVLDFKQFKDANPCVRTLNTKSVLDVHIHRDAATLVQKRLAAMVKQAFESTKMCKTLWSREHLLLTDASCNPPGTIPLEANLTFCNRFGDAIAFAKGTASS